jgi:hypothetical protein
MDRRKFNALGARLLAGVPAAWALEARALNLADVSQGETAQALKHALERGARLAVQQLARTDGYLGDDRVRIPLPQKLLDGEKMLRRLGQGKRLDELVTSMNRAAEAAVPQAQELLLDALRAMTVDDAKKILRGSDTAATGYFADRTRLPLAQRFLPLVNEVTGRLGLAAQYNRLAGKAADYGWMKREDASVEQHVTAKALDGLYLMIAEEERRIRRDPLGTGSALLGKVFGALQ